MRIQIEIPDGEILDAFCKAHGWNGTDDQKAFTHRVLLGYVKQRSVEGLLFRDVRILEQQKGDQVEATPIVVTEGLEPK